MEIIDFTMKYVEKAQKIALENYREERNAVPILPEKAVIPDMGYFADNSLGVAALEGDKLLGYLCAYQPVEDVFGTTNVRGTFSPVHAHGVLSTAEIQRITGKPNLSRGRLYSLLYQAAARK